MPVSFEDSRRDLIEWSYASRNILKKHIIISTARTASVLEGTSNVPLVNLEHGRSGGYQQVKNLLESGKIDVILLFGNPLQQETPKRWFNELVDAALEADAVVAYNAATIDMVLRAIDIHSQDDSCSVTSAETASFEAAHVQNT